MQERLAIAGMRPKKTEGLEAEIEIAIGMKTMITLNIATKGDLANGTRGEIVAIILDHREPRSITENDSKKTILQYPPAMILFKPQKPCSTQFQGVEEGLIPLFPIEKRFTAKGNNGLSFKVRRRQYTITAGYAFTDYKSQGQTIENVVVDLGKPPTGALTPFSAYVSLSRSRGRKNIRLLWDFERKLFTTHPSEDLRIEDERLREEDKRTRNLWTNFKVPYSVMDN